MHRVNLESNHTRIACYGVADRSEISRIVPVPATLASTLS